MQKLNWARQNNEKKAVEMWEATLIMQTALQLYSLCFGVYIDYVNTDIE